MNVPAGAIVGTTAGIAGAAAWAALAYFANLEIGWLAIGIGALVGAATSAGAAFGAGAASDAAAFDDASSHAEMSAGAPKGTLLGVIAVVITVASLCLGKYAVVEVGIQQALAKVEADFDNAGPMSDELLVSYVADEIGEETHGEDWYEQYEWPESSDGEQPDSQADYPTELWGEAQTRWDAMSDDERAAFRQATVETARSNMQQFNNALANEVRQEGFLATFGFMDLLFFGIAVATAWGIAGSGGDD